jgi:GNAT superfamily N-acetyltransferase
VITRVATIADIAELQALIARSVRELGAAYYTTAQIEAALIAVFGVDTQLIADRTYYVIDGPAGPIAAGGWSYRRTLYGGDQMKSEVDPKLDPSTEPARIRAFFVHPEWARRGLARTLYRECASEALTLGFRAFELMATLPGEPLYTALGFSAVERVAIPVGGGIELPLVRMTSVIGEDHLSRRFRNVTE